MMRHRLLLCFPLWLLAVVAVGLIVAFDRGGSPPVDAAPYTVRKTDHPLDPDWPDVSLILRTKCAGCHRPATERPDLTSYESVIAATDEDGIPLIVAGDSENSLLWQQVIWNHAEKLDSPHADEPEMPPYGAGTRLTKGQLASIARWIRNGALQYKLPNTCSPRPLLEIDFPSAKECQACHPKQYREWSRSMHAYAQHSPVFEAFNLTLSERSSGTLGTFCARCHTPLGTALGEQGSRRNTHRSRLSMEGVTCVACHRIARPYYKSNTRMSREPGQLLETCMYGPFSDPESDSIKSHASAGKPYMKRSAFCGACHDVTTPEGIRLEEAFSEWQNSPAARRGITCQHCHMGPVQGVPIPDHQRPLGRAAEVPDVDPKLISLRRLSDHTFSGPDYSMLPDTEFPHKLDWMYEVDYRNTERLTTYQKQTLANLRRQNRRQLRIAREKRYELLKNSAEIAVRAPHTAQAGSRLSIRVDVINKVAGHNFPTGFTAERQVWVEMALLDPSGRPVFLTGDVDHNGDLRDDHSHEVELGKLPYDRHLLNFQSKFVLLANKGTERSVIIPVNRDLAPLSILRPSTAISASFGRNPVFRLAKASLRPLATASRNYRVRLPNAPGNYRLRVRLNYRNLPPSLLDKIGVPHLKHLLETVVIDEHDSVICVH